MNILFFSFKTLVTDVSFCIFYVIETVPNGNTLKQFKECLLMIAKIYDSSFPMVVLGLESQDGNIIEGDFLSCKLTSKLMLSFYLFNLVCYFLVSTHGIMFEQAKVGIPFKTNYWFFILVHVCYGLEAARNRIFK